MVVQYKKSGGNAFKNNFATSDKHPKFTGNMMISSDVIKDLIAYAKNNTTPEEPENINKAKVKVAVWERTTKKGDPYMYIQLEAVPSTELKKDDAPFDDDNPLA